MSTIGFDTSNYTTSCSVCTESGVVLQNLKLPLPVSQGQRGLRQSEALFHHINQMPELIDKLENNNYSYYTLYLGVKSMNGGDKL